MKERIRELAKQAGLEGDNGHYEFDWFDPEKFAELLINKCAEMTAWKDFDMSTEQRIRLSVYHDIKQYFGLIDNKE